MRRTFITTLLVFSSLSYAHDNWTNSTGQVWRTNSGDCLRDGFWTPATAAPECAPDLQPKVVKVEKVAEVTKPKEVKTDKPTANVAQRTEVTVPVHMVYQAETLFDFDRSVIKPAGKIELDKFVQKVKGIKGVTMVIGHTDSVGSDSYNMKLGMHRAQAVKAFLVSEGMDANSIKVESYGERKPIADNKTREGRAKNRRVEIKLEINR